MPSRALCATPRVFLDAEYYREKTSRGRAGFFESKIILVNVTVVGSKRETFLLMEWQLGERRLLEELHKLLKSLAKQGGKKPLIGYGILTSDIPIVASRIVRLLGKNRALDFMKTTYRRFLIVDLFQYALFTITPPGGSLPNFRTLYATLMPEKGQIPVEGYDVNSLYEEGDYSRIESYSRAEMNMIIDVYEELLRKLRACDEGS